MTRLKIMVCTLCVTGSLGILTSPAQGGALDLITGDGKKDFLEDEDYETIVNLNGDSVTGNIGDAFVGIFRLQEINDTPVGSSTISAVVAARIKDVDTSVAGEVTYEFEALAGAVGDVNGGEWAALKAIYAALPSRASADSAILAYEDSSSPFLDVGAGDSQNDGIASASDGTKLFEFGFSGDTYAFFEQDLVDATNFRFRLALNLTDNSTALGFIDVTSSPFPGAGTGIKKLDGTDLPDAQMHVSGRFGAGDLGPWTIRTDADIFVNAVPEPGSMTLLGIAGLTLLGAGYRRRKKALNQAA